MMIGRLNPLLVAALLLLGTLAAGCGGGGEKAADAGGDAGSSADATTSPYDAGPRASTVAADPARAAQGKTLFSEKGCTACHGFGQRMAGPDLKGATTRRTEEWLTHWMSEPDAMLKTDPIARQLLAQYPTQMPNLHLSKDEVAALIDYLRLQDATLGATQ